MGVIRRFCNNCIQDTLHNESGKTKDAPAPRCTKCAQPYGTGPKSDRHKALASLVKKG
jgi:hypothetical protein